MSLRDKIITVYAQLGIAAPVPLAVAGGEENPVPIYERIYKAIAADPAAGRPILESIVGDKTLISYFAPHTRLALAALYNDLELAAKLLVDTVSYYKRKAIYYRGNDNSSEDESTPYWYSVILHCPDVYFRREFEWMCGCEQGAILRALMTSIGIDAAEIGYAKLSPTLWDFYRGRKEAAAGTL